MLTRQPAPATALRTDTTTSLLTDQVSRNRESVRDNGIQPTKLIDGLGRRILIQDFSVQVLMAPLISPGGKDWRLLVPFLTLSARERRSTRLRTDRTLIWASLLPLEDQSNSVLRNLVLFRFTCQYIVLMTLDFLAIVLS